MDNLKQQWQSDVAIFEAHRFNMGDVEDPDLWAAESLHKFEISDEGKWLSDNVLETMTWHRIPCEYGWQYQIRAKLSPEKYTYYQLRFK